MIKSFAMRKTLAPIVFALVLVSCMNAERNSGEVEEFESEDLIGTWIQTESPKAPDDITAKILRFHLFEDSTAELQYGESKEIKKGKWKMNPKMEVGNKLFGMSFETDLLVTFQSSETELANIGFNVREKNGDLILEGGAKRAVYQKKE